MTIESVFDRHERIALQLSGGKDSLACLYLTRPYWDRLTVYWLNTGRSFPETLAIMEHVRGIVPNFVEIDGNVDQVHSQFGIPSDIVPSSGTHFGRMVGHDAPLIQDRYSCCFVTKAVPMDKKMKEDGITLIIRGQRNDDEAKGTARNGLVENGVEYLFPVEDWTAKQVLRFLEDRRVPIPRFYEVLDEAPECMTCSAWWEKGAAKYLKRYHYEAYKEVQNRLESINQAVSEHIIHFNKEVTA
jgi:3'-phosphoadenosine 5'-phosphosulfate sulfotransferase (PAPS reductase)/FAD synthetase